MFERCVLHAGHAKTGTTALQAVFRVNRAALAEARIFYPEFNHHAALGNWYSRHRSADKRSPFHAEQDIAENRGAALTQWLASAAGSAASAAEGGMLVLSSEGLSGLLEDEIRALQADLAPHCSRIDYVMYAKHPLDFCPSFAQTQIKNGVKSIAQILEHPPRFSYARRLTEAAAVFGREHVHVRDASKECLVNGDVVDDFVSLLGSWGHTAPVLKRPNFPPNPSLNINAVVAADYLARLRGPAFLARRGTQRLLQSSQGPVFALPLELMPKVEAGSAADMKFLEAEYGLVLKANAKPRFVAVDFAKRLTPETKARLDRFSENQP